MKRTSVRLAVLLLLGVTASVAVAANVHFKKSPSLTFMDKVLF